MVYDQHIKFGPYPNPNRSPVVLEAHTYDEVCKVLANRFRTAYRRKDVNLTGLIFANPKSRFGEEEIVPHIDRWHHRSDNVTDFFCAGFGRWEAAHAPKDLFKVAALSGADWWFSAESFEGFVRDIEARSSWEDNGGANLIIATARYDGASKAASLDFRSAIVVDLEAMMKEEALRDPSELMYQMFRFAQTMNEDVKEPAWEFSDKLGLRVMKSGFIGLFWDWVSKLMGGGPKKARHFAVSDISPK